MVLFCKVVLEELSSTENTMDAIDTATVSCILNRDEAKEGSMRYEVDTISVKTEISTKTSEEYQDNLDKLNLPKTKREKEVVRATSEKVSNSNNECPFCYKTFNKLSKTKIHMVRHTSAFQNLNKDKIAMLSEGQWNCTDCGKRLISSSHIKMHIALVHYQLNKIDNLLNFYLSEKKKKCIPKSKPGNFCELCGKLYNNKTGLRRHTLIHTGERPFPCDQCEKRFCKKTTLAKHKKSHAR